jgi:superfamily II DNA helicase RecQ
MSYEVARELIESAPAFGFPRFRGYHLAAVNWAGKGRRILVLMSTGGGRNAGYQMPTLVRRSNAIVVSLPIAFVGGRLAEQRQLGVSAMPGRSGGRSNGAH